jgi:hypothetical protein
MHKLLSVAVLGVVATGLTVATPSTSHAQNFSVQFGYGGGGYHSHSPRVNFGLGYNNYGYGNYGYGSGYGLGGYNRFGSSGFGHGHGYGSSYYCPDERPVIIQPTYHHWTPSKGFHSHGNIYVPHGNHYDVHRY